MAKNFRELQTKMSPARQEQIKARVLEAEAEMFHTEIRKWMQQADPQIFANDPAIREQIEGQDDLPLTMLSRIVQHLGGELELIARMPNETIRFSTQKKTAQDAA